MKTLMLAGTTLLAANALAGVHIENVTRDIKTQAPDGDRQVMLVQDGKLHSTTGHGAFIIDGSNIIIVDDKKREYREMTKEDMKKLADQAGDAMKRMQEKMKNMKPEQREMMEKMMGNKMPGGMGGSDKPDTWEAKDLGKTDKVEGRSCALWTMSRNGALFEELCVVPFGSLPGKENLEKVFKDLAASFADIGKQFGGASNTAQAFGRVNGYPVRTRRYDADGNYRGNETVLTKWVEEKVPASTFAPPPGYTKLALPTFPAPH